ncbi:8714_t:CDS:2, partial [Paraglomus occultum]
MTRVKKAFFKSTRGRKARNISKLDFTGREPVIALENSPAQKVTKKSVDNKKDRHLFAMVEEQVDELAQEPVVQYENTTVIDGGIGRLEFALMTTQQLRDYAELFATTLAANEKLIDN